MAIQIPVPSAARLKDNLVLVRGTIENSKKCQEILIGSWNNQSCKRKKQGGDSMIEPIAITTEELSNQRIIYIRFRGSYGEFRKQSRKLFKELFDFATKNDLIVQDETKVLTMYDDNPFITQEKKLRTSVAMTIPQEAKVVESGNVCESSISGKFGVGHFEMNAKQYGEAWQYMYQEWLFKDKAKSRDAVPFELYVTEPPKNMKDTSLTDIYIPIV